MILVPPDADNIGVMCETHNLRRREFGRKTIERISKTINFVATADLTEDGVVFLLEKVDIAPNRRRRCIEARTRCCVAEAFQRNAGMFL